MKSLEEKRALTGTFAYLLDYYEHRTLTLAEVIDFDGEIHLEELDNISISSTDNYEKKLDENLKATLPSSRMRRLRTSMFYFEILL